MIKISVSQAAKRLHLSRKEVQKQISTGTLQTHEGYVTLDSIRLAYPTKSIVLDTTDIIEKTKKIKENSSFTKAKKQFKESETESKLKSIIVDLKIKIKRLEKELSTLRNK